MAGVKLTTKIVNELAPNSGTTWDSTERGFGVRAGKTRKTFIYSGRLKGSREKRTFTIAVLGAPHPSGAIWTLKLARIAASRLRHDLAQGIDPIRGPAKPSKAVGPTLRDGLELHLANMAKRKRSPRSVATVRQGIETHLKSWLDRPIVELTSKELGKVHDDIIAHTAPRAGSANPPGQALAKRVIVNVGTSWASLNKQMQGALGGWNPSLGVETHSLAPRKERLGDGEGNMPFVEWYGKVLTLAPIRRDLQLMALLTGIRADGIRQLRWEDVDAKAGTLHVRIAKGDKPYSVPLVARHLAILEERRAGNEIEFGPYGGDHGWIFPSLSRAGQEVICVAESKEWRTVRGKKEKFLPGLHSLRRTYNSVAAESGVDEFTRKVLMNHTITGVNGKHYTVIEDLSRFTQAQERIVDTLWAHLVNEMER